MRKIVYVVTVLCVSVLFTNCTSKRSESNKSTTDSTTQSTTKKATNVGAWQVVKVKDEFGDIVPDKSTIAADFKGKMSNNVTSDADLTVTMQVLDDSTIVGIFYEYNKKSQAKLPETQYITAKIKLADGEVTKVKMLLFHNMMWDHDKKLFKLLMTQSSPIKVIVDLSDVSEYETTIYNFEIDPTGLKDLLK